MSCLSIWSEIMDMWRHACIQAKPCTCENQQCFKTNNLETYTNTHTCANAVTAHLIESVPLESEAYLSPPSPP